MSGGHFNYNDFRISDIAEEIEQLILTNDSDELNEWNQPKGNHLAPKTIARFQEALTLLRKARVMVQRIDYLVSGDDGEETFHRRLAKDLAETECPETVIYAFKVQDYTTVLYGQRGTTAHGTDCYFVQRGDGDKYEYEDYRIVWAKEIARV